MKRNFRQSAKMLAVILSAATAVTMSSGPVFADSESGIAKENSEGYGLVEEENIEDEITGEKIIEGESIGEEINDGELLPEEPAETIIPEPEETGGENGQDGIPEWAVDDEGNRPMLFDAYSLPYRFDMRDYGWVTPVKLQNPWGSCWSFGGTAAAESSILSSLDLTAKESGLDLSERHMVWNVFRPVTDNENPSQAGEGLYTYDESINAPFDAGGGAPMLSALYASGAGPLEEAYYPYWGKDKLTVEDTLDQSVDDAITANAAAYGITEEQFIQMLMNNRGFKSEQEVREYIASVLRQDLTYSKYDDWSIPATTESGQSTRNLSEGFVLKNSTVIPDYYTAEGEASQDAIRAMKQEMINGRAVNIAYAADQSGTYVNSAEFSTDGSYGENVYGGVNYAQYTDQFLSSNHSVCVVGWDDNFAVTNFKEGCQPPGNGAWIVKNSWGSETDAAEDANDNVVNKKTYGAYDAEGKTTGYFYLSYYDRSINPSGNETFEFSTNLAGNGSFGVSQYDYLPGVAMYYTYDTPDVLSAANVFTAEADSDLISISTRCANTNTRVIYAVYLLDENAENPADGELVRKGSVNYEYGGFHRIDMDLPVHLEKGQRFSVITTGANINPDGSRRYAISTSRAIDYDTAAAMGAKYYARSVINEGESFLYEGGAWTDWRERAAAEIEKFKAETDQGILLDNFSIKAYFVPSEYEPVDISDPFIQGIKDKTYTGAAITQDFTVSVGGRELAEGTDYEVSYKNNINAGIAQVTITGINGYTGSITREFGILPVKLRDSDVTLKTASYTYNGKAKKPAVTVTSGGTVLTQDTDYTVKYTSNTNAGTATITIKGKGNYSGMAKGSFKISKAANPLKIKVPSKTYANKKLTEATSFNIGVSKAQGKVTYTLDSKAKSAKIKVSTKGKVTIPKKCGKGTYKITVKAAGGNNYKVGKKAVTIKVK